MNCETLIRRRIFILLLILLSACRAPCGPTWELVETTTPNVCFNSAKIYLLCEDLFQSMDLELVRSHSGLRMYINLYLCPVMPTDKEKQTIEIQYKINEAQHTALAFVLDGGQRLLLMPETCAEITAGLIDGDSVELTVDLYHAELPNDNFARVYAKMMALIL